MTYTFHAFYINSFINIEKGNIISTYLISFHYFIPFTHKNTNTHWNLSPFPTTSFAIFIMKFHVIFNQPKMTEYSSNHPEISSNHILEISPSCLNFHKLNFLIEKKNFIREHRRIQLGREIYCRKQHIWRFKNAAKLQFM